MEALRKEEPEVSEEVYEEISLKSALYNSVIFVGGGLVFFWLLLFITYTRG